MPETPSPLVELLADGKIYRNWTSARVSRSIEQACGDFTLELADREFSEGLPPPILPGSECELRVRAGLSGPPQIAVTGYVDDVSVNYDAQGHSTGVAGRDKAADLVDCSAAHGSGQWSGRTILQIARDLCRPFGITPKKDVDEGKAFSEFAIEEGESVFDCLRRAALMRGLLLISDGRGGIVFTRAGKSGAASPLELGRNIEQAAVQLSWKDRFSAYTVKGQGSGAGTPDDSAAPALQAKAKDEGITRHRPLIVLAEEAASIQDVRTRADHERSVRLARGLRYTATVGSWFDSDGNLWEPNTLVPVKDERARLDGRLLLVSVALQLDEGGSSAVLELVAPEAYSLLPAAAKGQGLLQSLAQGKEAA